MVYEPGRVPINDNEFVGGVTGSVFDPGAGWSNYALNSDWGRTVVVASGSAPAATGVLSRASQALALGGYEDAFAVYVVPSSSVNWSAASDWQMIYSGGITPNASHPWVVTYGVTYARPDAAGDSTSAEVGSTDAQRAERQAAARLASDIEALVPDLSEADLARLVGVSRLTWRDWANGRRVARRSSRRRLLRLRRILELRRRVSEDESLGLWLDTPLGADLDVTPAQLLAEGRDQVVAILAARARPSGVDEFVVEDSGFEGLLDGGRVERELAIDREIATTEPERTEV